MNRSRGADQGQGETTRRQLERAAVRLLTDGGLLAGFTLQQVGDEVGVAKGLVYHYFGDRQRLLRSALRHGAKELQSALAVPPGTSPTRRLGTLARATLAHPAAVQLTALLIVDRDPRLRTMPIKEHSLAAYTEDVEAGHLPKGTDIEAGLGVQNALVYGYVMFREGLARQTGVSSEVLDRRFLNIVATVGRNRVRADFSGPDTRLPAMELPKAQPEEGNAAQRLEVAAVDLIEEEGILSGVNLRQLADRAGVHRGLIYHYFGSRRELLLSALRRCQPALAHTSKDGVPGDLLFASCTLDDRPVRLLTLLATDGDPTYEPFGPLEGSRPPSARDMAGVCVALGHGLYRRHFARELGIPLEEWDRRVFATWARVAP